VKQAREAKQDSFQPKSKEVSSDADDRVLFTVSITPRLIRWLVLFLILNCHNSFRGGLALLALPGLRCRSDVFHAIREMGQVATYPENRAYGVMTSCVKQERSMRRAKRKSQGHKHLKRLALARQAEFLAVRLVTDVSTLLSWMRDDVTSAATLSKSKSFKYPQRPHYQCASATLRPDFLKQAFFQLALIRLALLHGERRMKNIVGVDGGLDLLQPCVF